MFGIFKKKDKAPDPQALERAAAQRTMAEMHRILDGVKYGTVSREAAIRKLEMLSAEAPKREMSDAIDSYINLIKNKS